MNRAVVTIGVVVASQFLNAFTGSALNVSIPIIGSEFAAAAADLGWIVTAYNICTVALLLPLGRLADLTSRRVLFIAGLTVLAVVAELAAWTQSLGALVACRVGQGLGASLLFATGQALLVSSVAPANRGRAIGWSVASVYLGLSLGPVAGGVLTHHLGWRSIFHIIAVFSLLAAVFSVAKLRQPAPDPAEAPAPSDPPRSLFHRLDPFGSTVVTIGAVLLTYGLTDLPDPAAVAALAAGVVLLAVFVRHERRTASPLLPPALFRAGPNFMLSNLSALLNYAATFAVSYLLSIYLQQVRGFGADTSGLVLITAPAVQAVLSPVAGRLADKRSPFALASSGMAICTACLVAFACVTQTTPLPVIVATLAALGFGFGLFASPNTSAILSLVDPADLGLANAFVSAMRNLGMVGSMAVITIMVRARFGSTPLAAADPSRITSTMRLAFILFAAICALGVFTSSNRRATPRSGP